MVIAWTCFPADACQAKLIIDDEAVIKCGLYVWIQGFYLTFSIPCTIGRSYYYSQIHNCIMACLIYCYIDKISFVYYVYQKKDFFFFSRQTKYGLFDGSANQICFTQYQ